MRILPEVQEELVAKRCSSFVLVRLQHISFSTPCIYGVGCSMTNVWDGTLESMLIWGGELDLSSSLADFVALMVLQRIGGFGK